LQILSDGVRRRERERERERGSVQSLLTAWLHISLQHGTYLSSASHSLEHLTLWFVKKKEGRKKKENSNKNKA